jgi:hypothetical protein
MGGEIRYVVKLKNDDTITVITTIKSKSYYHGDRVIAHVKPQDCLLLSPEE